MVLMLLHKQGAEGGEQHRISTAGLRWTESSQPLLRDD